jgi:hypothetical protein
VSEKPKTLGYYRDMFALAGEDNKAVRYLDKKIADQGRDEPVLAAESQMLMLLAHMLEDTP